MSIASPSKYAENQFEGSTRANSPLMSEILSDTYSRATGATTGNPAFTSALSNLQMIGFGWDGAIAGLTNSLAQLKGATQTFEAKMMSLTKRNEEDDTNSEIEIWDSTIRTQVTYQGPVYTILLPNGRDTVTSGTYEARLTALTSFAQRLADQTTKPVLVTLGATVSTWVAAAEALRATQTVAKGTVESARQTVEQSRLMSAAALFALIGTGITAWSATPERVDTLFDVGLMRNPPLEVPDAPANTTWTPALRTLSTTVMPLRATRLSAWRIAPGGMPEHLATGETGETSVIIPVSVTWNPGALYQIWLVALNGRGPSPEGPIQNWTAV